MEKTSQKFTINAVGIPCFDFIGDEGRRERKTVVIAPIVFEEIKMGVLQVSYACSRSLSCRDRECRYSKKGNRREEDYVEEPEY